MKLTLDNPVTVAAPFGDRFAHVARLDVGGGALLVLSGQISVDDRGEVYAPGDIAAQTERIFEIVGGLLAAHGAGFGDVLHIRTFMTDLDDLPGYGAARRRLFPGTPPASTTVEVSRLFLAGALLEVEVTAAALRGRGQEHSAGEGVDAAQCVGEPVVPGHPLDQRRGLVDGDAGGGDVQRLRS
ncbi:RidA family protein [Phytohabitans rumicis]|uniref:RidA family protein n=1 Tax=Phytohabitans rumicis TaxID=1076125 RepID=UPI001C49C149